MLIGIVLSDLRPALAGGSRNPLKIGLEGDHEASGLTARHHAVVKGERQRQYAPTAGWPRCATAFRSEIRPAPTIAACGGTMTRLANRPPIIPEIPTT